MMLAALLRYRALLAVAGTIALLSLAGYGWQAYQQHRNARAIERPAAAHADSLALQAARRADFDRRFYTATGRTLEAGYRATISRRQYDSLRHLLPAALPQLPATPPRYRRP